jgi:ClpP class serine protease
LYVEARYRGDRVGEIINLLWFALFASSFLLPLFRTRRIERLRFQLIRDLERKRKSRVVTLVHRQEAINFLGIPIARYINIEDSEEILRVLRLTPDDLPIDLILHTPGGLVLAAEQIALAMRKRSGKVTVLVPHYAMSGGTMLALAASEIIMDENAVLGPVDPQIGSFPAASILAAVERKPPGDIDDETLILADMARKAIVQVKDTITHILEDKMPPETAGKVSDVLTKGYWTHDYPLTVRELQNLGLSVRTGLPKEVYMLMELYPQPGQRRPSVLYVPMPYRRENDGPGRG